MPKTDRDPLGPGFAWRLRSELDRVRPLWSSPRYLGPMRRSGAWRVAPAALAVALTSLLGLTAFAATGSANPAIWTERVVTIIHPVPPTPTPETTPAPPAVKAAPPPAAHNASPKPSERPEPSEGSQPSLSPQPRESPEPTGDRSPTASPSPGDH